jgi:heme-degrading monooxygenase HmoA
MGCQAGLPKREASRSRGGDMFVRKVSARLKPNSLAEFANLMELEILPWLQKQEGFRDLIVLAASDGREVATLSFWEDRRDAQAYGASGYPEVLKILEDLLDGSPYVKTFDVVGPMPQMIAQPQPENVAQQKPTWPSIAW